MNRLHVLLVEDDEPLAGTVAAALEHEGWSVEATRQGRELVPRLSTGRFDVAVLDINLPDIDGFAALEQARVSGIDTPILVLTARDAIEDRLAGLEGGAEDYLLKPFELSELIARLRIVARRRARNREQTLELGPLRMNLASHSATLGGTPLELSRREWLLLHQLLANEGRVVQREDIVRTLADGATMSDNAVEVYVFRLRSKIEPAGIRLRTVRGFGYMLEPWRAGPA